MNTKELADYIIDEIEKEDFILAIKKYGSYRIKKFSRTLLEWWNEL